MVLSRVWYVLLGVAVAVALYVVFVALGQYNRQTTLGLKEGLASDSQTVEWALKIDARRRMDALLVASVDPALQQALVAANAKDAKVPDKARSDARKALGSIGESIPSDWRNDVLFAVDRDGRVVAQSGYDVVAGNDEFELGGYPAVNDALHGWLRDDVWFLGSKMYVVVARPVEYDVTQRPAGAIVGLKEVNKRFVDDLARRTRTNLVFYVAGKSVAAATGTEGFDPERLDGVGTELKDVDDKAYGDGGRTDARMLSDEFGAMFARLPGETWSLGGGFAVLRSRAGLTSPTGFLSNADDKDKANVPWLLLVAVALLAGGVGIGLTFLEHTAPIRELLMQAGRLKSGAMEHLQVARFRGAYRLAAQEINEGLERAIEKAGGVTRKPADLEAILGPAPAQPAMSAFSFPNTETPAPPEFAPSSPLAPALPGTPPRAPPAKGGPGPNFPVAGAPPSSPGSGARPPPLAPSSGGGARPPVPATGPRAFTAAMPTPPSLSASDDDATTVGSVPAEVMAQATGYGRPAPDDSEEWQSVYNDFVNTKRQCGEPVDGLTFEKFSHTLRKNRDALVQRHGCRRVRFSVYVKEGRASLKAMPIRD